MATNVVDKSHEDLVHDLNQLAPTLHQLAAAGDALPKSLETLVTFPFPGQRGSKASGMSDYTNLYLKVDLNLSTIVDNLGRSRQPLLPVPDGLPLPLNGQTQQPQKP
ncbi:hypothetical protein FHU35_13735, partial [Saccharopolyspora dendranthemae]